MTLEGAALATVWRKTVHQAMLVSDTRREGESSSCTMSETRKLNKVKLESYPCRVLVSLKCQVQHLTGLVALLVYQLIADGQQTRKAGFDNLVKVCSIVAVRRLEPKSAANGKETLQTSEDGGRGVCVEQLRGEAHEVWPFGGEVGLEHALDDWDELLAHELVGISEKRHETVSDAVLFLIGYQFACGDGLGGVPGSLDAVLEEDDCWEV